MTITPITADQAHMLDALRAVGSMTFQELKAITGLHDKRFYPAKGDLIARALAETPRTKMHQPRQLHITTAGAHALADYQREVAAAKVKRALPPTYNTQGTRYVPPKGVFYRNNGNSHIASYGARC